jgi:hypothetical protein
MTTSDPKEYVPVYTSSGKLAGDMIRLMLEAQGIPVILRQESVGLVHGLTISPLGDVHVCVPPDRVEEAEQILQDMEEGRLEENASDLVDMSGEEPVDDAYLSENEDPGDDDPDEEEQPPV